MPFPHRTCTVPSRANELGDGSVGAVGCVDVVLKPERQKSSTTSSATTSTSTQARYFVLQPTLEIATSWSTDRLSPMVQDTPVLKKLVADPKARDSGFGVTKLHKKFIPRTSRLPVRTLEVTRWHDRFALCCVTRRIAIRLGRRLMSDPISGPKTQATNFSIRFTMSSQAHQRFDASRVEALSI